MSEAMVTVSQNRKSGVCNPKTFSGVRGNIFLKYVVTMLGSGLFLYVIFANTVNVDYAWDQVQNIQDEIRNLSMTLQNVTEESQPQSEGCPANYIYYKDYCYGFFVNKTQKLKYAEAKEKCKYRMGYNLASVISRDETKFLGNMTVEINPAIGKKSFNFPWIGLHKDAYEPDGAWIWADGFQVSYTNWNANEPNSVKSREHCVHIYPGGEWNDVRCDEPRGFICKGPSISKEKPRQFVTDFGYDGDCPRGWFDMQNQGVSNDYCRWVGNCGCSGSCSWWSCALAGSSSQYTPKGEYEMPESFDNCRCKDLINRNGVGNCKGTKPSQFNGDHLACYVHQPSSCTDLEDSISNPGEKLSAKACKSMGQGSISGSSRSTNAQPEWKLLENGTDIKVYHTMSTAEYRQNYAIGTRNNYHLGSSELSDAYTKVCEQCWCGSNNRKDVEIRKTLESCKSRCNQKDDCLGIEYWHGGGGHCYQCLDPASHKEYSDRDDRAWPPSVYRKSV